MTGTRKTPCPGGDDAGQGDDAGRDADGRATAPNAGTPAPHDYGADGWLTCVMCDDEVLAEDAKTCDSGEDLCPKCWAEAARELH